MPTHHTMMSARSNPQQFYERLLASVEGIFWEADAQTLQFTYVSEQAEHLLGYPLAEWTTPDFWLNHIHPDDRTWTVTFCQRATHENRNHSTGRGRDKDGAVQGIIGIARDITELKRREEQFRQAQKMEAVGRLVRLVLQSDGYPVLEAEQGHQAIALATAHPEPIHLLLTDLVMPQMSGRQLAEQIALLRPAIQLLFMSGYTQEAMTHHQMCESNIAFLPKPFDPRHLAHKVRESLDG